MSQRWLSSVGDSGRIGADGSANAVFTNTKAEGGLVVSKKVISALKDDHDAKYDITITLDDTGINGTFGDVKFKDGIVKTIRWNLEHQDWIQEVTSGDYQKYYEQMYGDR